MVRDEVQLPATLLMVTGALGAVLSLGGIAMNVLGTGMGALIPASGTGGEQMVNLFSGVMGIGFNLIGLAVSAFVIYGAMQMKELRSYAMSIAAAVLAILPCGPCCCIGLPVGIWALVVLLRPEVKAAFVS